MGGWLVGWLVGWLDGIGSMDGWDGMDEIWEMQVWIGQDRESLFIFIPDFFVTFVRRLALDLDGRVRVCDSSDGDGVDEDEDFFFF
ncbi:hypothetical protein C7212DRAFT_314035 [Tuber magnatum]|uniref:Uncharacterized protein n=1 Tax=Tuber magnatum TaxID=42249 RepID=A0A317SVG1_9PEZI|nr:hypothetical protein C7212DRAFT_314035 [Tuber magnatum]